MFQQHQAISYSVSKACLNTAGFGEDQFHLFSFVIVEGERVESYACCGFLLHACVAAGVQVIKNIHDDERPSAYIICIGVVTLQVQYAFDHLDTSGDDKVTFDEYEARRKIFFRILEVDPRKCRTHGARF
jgi:hypothetical protein